MSHETLAFKLRIDPDALMRSLPQEDSGITYQDNTSLSI